MHYWLMTYRKGPSEFGDVSEQIVRVRAETWHAAIQKLCAAKELEWRDIVRFVREDAIETI